MKRLFSQLLAAACLTAMTLPAAGAGAAASAAQCNTDLIVVSEWKATPTGSNVPYVKGSVSISFTMASTSSRAVEMLSGGVEFNDALGRTIVILQMDEDTRMHPLGKYDQSGLYPPGDADRLATINPDHVTATACVLSVLYDDGTVERFPN